MPLNAMLLPEFEQEMASTRRLLERVPVACLHWKPHPKSMTLSELATHVATIPGWTATTLHQDVLDMGAPDAPALPAPATSREQLLELFDRGVAEARKALQAASDETLAAPWTLRVGEKVVFTLPRTAVLRSFILSHGIHHRGQLEVYLRLQDVPLPAIYGPSADEGQM